MKYGTDYYTLGEGATELAFEEGTPRAVAEALHRAYLTNYTCPVRVRIWYGDPKSGHARPFDMGVIGRIMRAEGSKIPILVYDKRSSGGMVFPTKEIVRIAVARKGGRVLYEHPTFDVGCFRIGGDGNGLVPVCHQEPNETDWTPIAHFGTWKQAARWTGFMTGKRFTK